MNIPYPPLNAAADDSEARYPTIFVHVNDPKYFKNVVQMLTGYTPEARPGPTLQQQQHPALKLHERRSLSSKPFTTPPILNTDYPNQPRYSLSDLPSSTLPSPNTPLDPNLFARPSCGSPYPGLSINGGCSFKRRKGKGKSVRAAPMNINTPGRVLEPPKLLHLFPMTPMWARKS
ncbi:hypothetical protein ACFE04_000806 [Oxalis oulophora]